MKKVLSIAIVSIMATIAYAKTASEMFISMPDSMISYMSAAQRTELLGMKVINPDSIATLDSAIGHVSVTTLNENRLYVILSDKISLEIGRINDNKFVVIKTYGAPERESTVLICDSLWQNATKLDFSKENFFADSLLLPENAEQLTETRKLIEFPLVEAHLSVTPGTILLRLNAPFLTKEEKEKLRKCLVTKNYILP